MTRTKKLVSLFLAMLMVFSLMAVTASAYDSEDGHVHTEACEDEGIMPRTRLRRCSDCPNGTVYINTVNRYMKWETTCSKCSYRHYHSVPYTVDIEDCDSCSYYAEKHNNDLQFPGTCLHE